MSTWLITGCSTGLGRALAEAAISSGHNVVATARDVTAVADLGAVAPERTLTVALDVTHPEQIAHAVAQAEQCFGGVDVLVTSPHSSAAPRQATPPKRRGPSSLSSSRARRPASYCWAPMPLPATDESPRNARLK
jgi:NAD(P)-dependent dehydrogenase (short-subunit alcohol dehydrogenase family)